MLKVYRGQQQCQDQNEGSLGWSEDFSQPSKKSGPHFPALLEALRAPWSDILWFQVLEALHRRRDPQILLSSLLPLNIEGSPSLQMFIADCLFSPF